MNIEVKTLINFSGEIDGLTPLLNDIANVLIDHGYSGDTMQDEIRSIILVRETEINKFSTPTLFLINEIKESIVSVIPMNKEETDERTGD